MEAARKKKRKLPDWFLAEPPELAGVTFFHEAYRDLVTCRRVDCGPIPWDAVALYAECKELEADVAEALWTVIRKMDLAERQWHLDNPPPDVKPPETPRDA